MNKYDITLYCPNCGNEEHMMVMRAKNQKNALKRAMKEFDEKDKTNIGIYRINEPGDEK